MRHCLTSRVGGASIALLLALAPLAGADRVVLKNGGNLDGLVLREDDRHITLQVGPGTMRIERDQVLSIEHATPEEQGRLQEQWRRQYYLHEAFVPADHADAATSFRNLQTLHQSARRSAAIARKIQRQQDAIRQTSDRMMADLQSLAAKLRVVDPGQDTAAYNAIVVRINTLRADLDVKMSELTRLNTDRDKALGKVAEYTGTLSDFEAWFESRVAATGGSDSQVQDFYQRLGADLQLLTGEFSDAVIQSRQEGGSTIVTATLNGNVVASFVLDTGASLVSLSESLAMRLGVDVATLPISTVRVADGRRVDARAIMLKSVKVGEAYVEDVPAVVLPDHEGAGPDGLLGMSFLRNFIIRIDGSTGNLVLRQLKP